MFLLLSFFFYSFLAPRPRNNKLSWSWRWISWKNMKYEKSVCLYAPKRKTLNCFQEKRQNEHCNSNANNIFIVFLLQFSNVPILSDQNRRFPCFLFVYRFWRPGRAKQNNKSRSWRWKITTKTKHRQQTTLL